MLTLIALTAACDETERRFEPGCIAFEGDTLTITGNRFEWDRFTDQLTIGADGQRVDPFPDFPKSGTIEARGSRLVLTTAAGEQLEDWFIVQFEGRTRLLTAAEHDVFSSGGPVADCALVAVPIGN